jgi:WS/DGAT/MGAT family acyltransferase
MGLSHALPAADAAWLRMDRPENLMVINAVLLLDEPLGAAALRDVLRERLVDRFPRFRQRVTDTVGGPAFEDDPRFDIDLHLHHLALPAPGDRDALQAAIQPLMVRPLDRSRALWEVYLFDGYEGGSAVLARIHHCIGDGIALARVLLSLTDFAGAGSEIRPAREDAGQHGFADRVTRPIAGLASLGMAAARAVVDEGREALSHPDHLGDIARTTAQDTGTLAKLLLSMPDVHTQLRGDLTVATRVAWSEPVALGDVREAAHALGVTINDLVVAAVAGAARDYLEDLGDLPGRDMHAVVPFNLRPLDEPLPAWLGNRFGLLLLALPTGVEDARERIAEAKRRMDAIKTSHEGLLSYGLISSIGLTPSRVEKLLIDFFTTKGSMVLTNVPGPPEPVHLAGVPVGAVHIWAPASGSVPMSVSVFSYAGKISVGFLTDAGLVPDPQRLADAFRDELLRATGLAAHASPHEA